jgi:protein-L-isoaspartate(D-aspartate) O-methyltransferase
VSEPPAEIRPPDLSAAAAAPLREALADELVRRRAIVTPGVEAAFRAVPRHLFLPAADLRAAYAARVIVTRHAGGRPVSAASHPGLVAQMLEQLAAVPGHRVLEIGAGTGINAALLAELAGRGGAVTTIDIDADAAAQAARGLAAAGYPAVRVLTGDGAAGHPPGAPYDRIIVTAGAWDLPPAWLGQLAPAGRLVVPLRLHGSGLTRCVALEPGAPGWLVSRGAVTCRFVPMRGTTQRADHFVRLADGVTLELDNPGPAAAAGLRQALRHPRHEQWTGIMIAPGERAEHLDLWLACACAAAAAGQGHTAGASSGLNGNADAAGPAAAGPGTADPGAVGLGTAGSGAAGPGTARFGRLLASHRARVSGIADPPLRLGGAALHGSGSVAWLGLRPGPEGAQELGVIAHGPAASRLAREAAVHLRSWDRSRPAAPVITAAPAGTPDDQLPPGLRVDRPSARLTISW